MLGPLPFNLYLNPRFGTPGVVVLPARATAARRRRSPPGTAIRRRRCTTLPGWHAQAGIAAIRLKDEAGRFDLGSFKALGGAYAVAGVLASELARRGVALAASSAELGIGRYRDATRALTVTCATDGNHGRSVAWGAQRFHCRCVIFVHAGVSQGRMDAIAALRRRGAPRRRDL